MTASTVWINGVPLGEYKGGFTPFSFELTAHLRINAENVLVVQLDSTERADIPPFGDEIDYLTFGGIYREVSLRIVPPTYIDNIFARPTRMSSPPTHRSTSIACSPVIRSGGVSRSKSNSATETEASRKRFSPSSSTAAPDPNASMDPVIRRASSRQHRDRRRIPLATPSRSPTSAHQALGARQARTSIPSMCACC